MFLIAAVFAAPFERADEGGWATEKRGAAKNTNIDKNAFRIQTGLIFMAWLFKCKGK